MDERQILPPGRHPHDPLKADIDPIGYALNKIQTSLLWIDEHRSSFEQLRHCDPASAQTELDYLEDSVEQALSHLHRLIELLLAGFTLDPNKRLPKGLVQGADMLRSYLNRRREN
ncbi:MAG TPA: hypothetical protein VH592_08785 [Gemmataceae bacterium]|jgi:hypothetical protein